MTDTRASATPDPIVDDSTDVGNAAADRRPALPQFALAAANRQIGRVSEVLTSTAESIDTLLAGNEGIVPEGIRDFGASTADRLRGLAGRADEQDAGRLVETLQRTAANHPVATAGIGAAIGAVLGLALVRLGRSTDHDSPTSARS